MSWRFYKDGKLIAQGECAPISHQQNHPAPALPAFLKPGPRLWAELFLYALCDPPGEMAFTAWFAVWEAKVARFLSGCGCWEHWKEIRASNPPIPEDLFAWAWARKNDVNRRLGQPEISLDAARAFWTAEFERRKFDILRQQ